MDQLDGVVQAYAWGDRGAIATLQEREPTGEPEAELWLGAHPAAPSRLRAGAIELGAAVERDPVSMLGPAVAERFGGLPFLLKVLAAAEPLSIQAHPTATQAKRGFSREEAAGLASNSPTRSYRDDRHKPELICAVTPFEAKCGFRSIDETRRVVDRLIEPQVTAPGLAELASRLAEAVDDPRGLGSILRWLLALPPVEAVALVAEAVAGAVACSRGGPRPIDGGSGRAGLGAELRWTIELDRFHPGDIGVVVALLLNHVSLSPGEALFLPAGNLHSYLRGVGIEIMANSDNVIRGGLTRKHIDVEELSVVVDPRPTRPQVQVASAPLHRFDSPVPEFSLTRIDGEGPNRFEPEGPEIVLVTDGVGGLQTDDGSTKLVLRSGRAAFVAHADGPYRLEPAGQATAWRATVGDLRSSRR